jgi:hypothetical protein
MPNHHHSIHHSIHLGTAWEPPAVAEADGHVLWTRRFGRPGGLEPGDVVLLVVTQPAAAAEMVLNTVCLLPLSAGVGRWEQDITPLLRGRNELLIRVAPSENGSTTHGQQGRGQLPSVIGTVALEIVAAGTVADGPAGG